MSKPVFAHLDDSGGARMVDVGSKRPTLRSARAEARVRLGPDIARKLAETGGISKGNVLETARVAGIMAAKRTAELIPLCHSLNLDVVEIDCRLEDEGVAITAEAHCTARTGVEMEALTAVTIAALTVYDMCKSAGRGIVIESIRLLEKSGGRSGRWASPQTGQQQGE